MASLSRATEKVLHFIIFFSHARLILVVSGNSSFFGKFSHRNDRKIDFASVCILSFPIFNSVKRKSFYSEFWVGNKKLKKRDGKYRNRTIWISEKTRWSGMKKARSLSTFRLSTLLAEVENCNIEFWNECWKLCVKVTRPWTSQLYNLHSWVTSEMEQFFFSAWVWVCLLPPPSFSYYNEIHNFFSTTIRTKKARTEATTTMWNFTWRGLIEERSVEMLM